MSYLKSLWVAVVLFAFAPVLLAQQCEEGPSASISAGGIDPRTHAFTVTISHNKPDRLTYSFRGESVTPVLSSTGAPVVAYLSAACMTQSELVKVTATKCGQTIERSVNISPPDTTPILTASSTVGQGSSVPSVKFFFPGNHAGPLRATLLGSNAVNGIIHNEASTYASEGARSFTPGTDGGYVLIEAVSCIGVPGSTSLPAPNSATNCDNCQPCGVNCVGLPVHTLSGNMQYTDIDPIPGFEAIPFRRVYDSVASYDGHFGHRWSSIFGATLTTFQALDGSQYVNLRDERGDQFIFHGTTGGSYVQVQPKGGEDSTLHREADGTWVFSNAARTLIRRFNSSGTPVAFRDVRSGREVLLSWNGGRPTAVTDSWGAWSLTVTTDAASGRITAISLDGQPQLVWSYIYEENRLVRVNSPLGTWRTYTHEYHPTGFFWYPIKEVRDGEGRLIESHAYSGKNLASSSISDTDDITSIVIAQQGRVEGEVKAVVTYRTGRQELHYRRFIANEYRTVEIDGGCSSCGGKSRVIAYDDKGRPTRIQEADGYISEDVYDEASRVTVHRTALRPASCDPATAADRCRQLPDALVTVPLAPTDETTTTQFAYTDPSWPERATITTTNSVGKPGDSRVLTVSLHPLSGEVLTQVVRGWTGTPAQQETRTTVTTLYASGEAAAFTPGGSWNAAWSPLPQPAAFQKAQDGPRTDVADVSTYVYYPIHNDVPPLLRGRLAAVRNAAGHETRFENYDLFGHALTVVDRNGVVSTAQYDLIGRPTASTIEGVTGCDTTADPLCATPITTTRVWQTSGAMLSETRPGGAITTYEYDTLRRLTTMSRNTTAAEMSERIAYSFDPATGKRNAEVLSARSGASWVEKSRRSFAYDSLSQLKTSTNADNTSVEYAYDAAGRVISMRDENHAAPNTFYRYDAAGRLAEVRQQLGSGFATTSYGYDLHGNLVSVTDPNGNETEYRYDDFGQLRVQISPVTGTTTYTYDAAGQLRTTTDANGATTTRTYDALGRILTSVSTSGSNTETVTWTYDTGAFGVGRVSTMTDTTGSTSYAYERRGLLIREEKTSGIAVYTTRYGYDAAGNRTRIQYPSGRIVDYTFDRASRPISATAGTTSIVSSVTYLPFGPATQWVMGNGTTRNMTYDARYRPSMNELSSASGPIARYGYTHDAAGNITAIADQLDAGYNRTFTYDDLNRLTGGTTGASLWGTHAYSYDAMGNLLSAQLGARTSTFNYAGTGPKLQSVTENGVPRVVTYDPAGNETAVGAELFAHSPRNFVSGRYAYRYDGRGVRTVTAHPAYYLSSLTLSRPMLPPNESATGTVTLGGPAPAGGATVSLRSSDARVAVPSSVVITAGNTTAVFGITQSGTPPAGPVTIEATYGFTHTAALQIPVSPALVALSLDATSVAGGAVVHGTATLDAPAPAGGARVALSSNAAAASVPSEVTMSEGASQKSFDIQTASVQAAVTATLTASYGNSVSTQLEVRPVSLASLVITPSTIISGRNANGVVTLGAPAPPGGATVTLTSSAPSSVIVPASIVVSAGQTTQAFLLQVPPANVSSTVTITATYNESLTQAMTIQPCVSATAPAPTLPGTDRMWLDDQPPVGSIFQPASAWTTAQAASGTKSLNVPAVMGGHSKIYIENATQTMDLARGESLVMYVLLNECTPPTSISVGWQTTDGGSVMYVWGQSVPSGPPARAPLPQPGTWARLEVPAVELGLEWRSVRTVHIVVYNGQAWMDAFGVGKASCYPAVPPAPTFPDGDTVWVDDAMPAGATSYDNTPWDMTRKASGTQSMTRRPGVHSSVGFSGANPPLPVAWGENMVFYALLNDCEPPRKLRAQWFTSDGAWHGASWGEPTNGDVYMGALPPVGVWTRLEVSGRLLGVEDRMVTGFNLAAIGGQVWIDRVGKTGIGCYPALAPRPTVPSSDRVWIEDAQQPGTTVNPANAFTEVQAATGTKSFTRPLPTSGTNAIYFSHATEPMTPGRRESFVLYALLNECAPPRSIEVWWNDKNGGARSYLWGESVHGMPSNAPLPAAGAWTRLEVPASSINAEYFAATAFTIYFYGGQAWFDHIGVGAAACQLATPPPVDAPATDVVWVDDAIPTGAVLSGGTLWDTTQKASGTQSMTWRPRTGEMVIGFTAATQTLSMGPNEKVVFYTRIDECERPTRIRAQIQSDDRWHYAVWGQTLAGHVYMGDIPSGTDWVRMEIPASALGLENRILKGALFHALDGHAWFDRIGKAPASLAAVQDDDERAPIVLSIAGDYVGTDSIPEDVRRISLYSPELQLLAETASSSAAVPPVAHEYIWFGGQPVAQLDAAGTASWYFNDHLGTPILQTNASAQVAWRAEYEPYGTVRAFRAGAAKHQPLRFPGQENDGTTETSYNVFRWYRAGWGRYTQADPIGIVRAGGDLANLFAYTSGDPLNEYDPTGLDAITDDPGVQKCMWCIYNKAGQGGWNYEEAFWVRCTPDGFKCSMWPSTKDQGTSTTSSIKFKGTTPQDACAIVHTHPMKKKAPPSSCPGCDVDIADRLKMPIYSVHPSGVWKYDPNTKNTTQESGKTWWEGPKQVCGKGKPCAGL
jgi:RHS repeat-associated protein